MAKIEKLVEKMINQPHGIRFDEVRKVLEHHGYILDRVKGSHHSFLHSDGDMIVIPRREPVKAVYIKEILKRIGR